MSSSTTSLLRTCLRSSSISRQATHGASSLRALHTSSRPALNAAQWKRSSASAWLQPRQQSILANRTRHMHTSPALAHGSVTRPAPGTGIKVHFKDAKGEHLKTIEANEGDDLLSLAHEHDIDLEGACEGSIACSTCHVILSPSHYDLLPEPSDDENDMLDMAFGLTDTSRLGCQVQLTRDLDGMTATLPSATRNMFVDGHKPTHH
ncbi:ferredoxin [Coniophora puteana RWD-64-598 SS2]|uniref:Ferredoxin n=1 Tax=Coniophora puteana (strain RWD-64-598) TaxID=741705 RepID=A0A5M3MLV3_CONPW|nr:ferredoxin [Coniophora puteana RWD-64-598 SS2]EIW80093.1 ferredoxin [Coniophora puteana RWD-64-598 SS2]